MVDEIRSGAVVSLEYTLKLENGEIIDYSEAEEPLEYLHGADNIIPGLEKQIVGLHVGDERDVTVDAVEGYGDYDPEEVEVVERRLLPKDMNLTLGTVVAISDEEGNLSEAYVREIGPKSVTLDFNHPLAGQRLFFKVKVVDIREATEEEIEHGHPHGVDGHDDFYDEFEEFEDDEDFDDDDEDYLDEDQPNASLN